MFFGCDKNSLTDVLLSLFSSFFELSFASYFVSYYLLFYSSQHMWVAQLIEHIVFFVYIFIHLFSIENWDINGLTLLTYIISWQSYIFTPDLPIPLWCCGPCVATYYCPTVDLIHVQYTSVAINIYLIIVSNISN